eukprot:6192197-Pleurochrysis_carterae.AAC.1
MAQRLARSMLFGQLDCSAVVDVHRRRSLLLLFRSCQKRPQVDDLGGGRFQIAIRNVHAASMRLWYQWAAGKHCLGSHWFGIPWRLGRWGRPPLSTWKAEAQAGLLHGCLEDAP